MILDHLSQIPYFQRLHVVLGAFDGVHLAHQQLINYVCDEAKKNNEKSLILSFDPLPKEYFKIEGFKGVLLPTDKRKQILESFQADYTIVTKFESLKDFSEKDFIDLLLKKADEIILYSGGDFRLGNQSGEKYVGDCLKQVILDDVFVDSLPCRSSVIRNLISEGEVKLANLLLNREYTIYSYTVFGNQIGRKIDFPTINLSPNQQVIPKTGVYFGEIKIFNHIYPAAIYVGYRPTVEGKELRIESHIVSDFTLGDIAQNTYAEVTFIERISDEKCFDSLAELKEMLYNYKIISLGLATERYEK